VGFELGRLTPNIEENVTDQVFRHRHIANDRQGEAVNGDVIPREKHLHRDPVTVCDTRD
jgi:hypothetical protein